MEYSREQIEYIRKNKPEFVLKEVPSLDFVVVEFLKKYEVFVKPMTSGSRNVGEDVASGVLTGLAGPDVGLDAYGVSGQKKQTAVQEWTQWKQWALNHKDFEGFRAKRIDEPKAFNMKVLEKLKDPKVQKELEPLMEAFAKKDKAAKKGIIIGFLLFFGIFGGLNIYFFVEDNQIFKNNNRSSYVPRNIDIK
tara:strand:+ start:84 stop:659 length:576 start_codon:yes stop_codon:yes gene_type:complete